METRNSKSGNSKMAVMLSRSVMLNLFQHLPVEDEQTLKRVQGDTICGGSLGSFANLLIV